LILAATIYEQPLSGRIWRAKYSGSKETRDLRSTIADFAEKHKRGRQAEVVVSVPARLGANTRDLAEQLARAVGLRLHVPYWAGALVRTRTTPPLRHMGREERKRKVAGLFELARDVAGRRVLLVDDVTTTGSTFRECERILTAGAAKTVTCLALAGVQAKGTGEGGEMPPKGTKLTPKEAVLVKSSDAECLRVAGVWSVTSDRGELGSGKTAPAAWKDAAAKIEAAGGQVRDEDAPAYGTKRSEKAKAATRKIIRTKLAEGEESSRRSSKALARAKAKARRLQKHEAIECAWAWWPRRDFGQPEEHEPVEIIVDVYASTEAEAKKIVDWASFAGRGRGGRSRRR